MNDIATALSMPALLAWLILPVSLLLLAAFSSWTTNPLKLNHCWRIAGRLLAWSMVATLAIGGLLVVDAWLGDTGLPELGHRLGLQPDGLAVWMALMVAFIGWVILRYADNYLQGDPVRDRFLPWFLTTLASVLFLVFTNNLLVLAGAWVGVSLALHHLLTLYQDRPEARLAALQKFIVSRIGDACVIGGVLLLYTHYGTFHLPVMQALSAEASQGSIALEAASVLLAVAAVLKCAQIPFHGWLLRVMEAPTPVSALLHAGVINLGGFLWLRLFPVFDGFTAGHMILLAVGGITAVVGILTMMSQPSVKHALAWSTSAQMGFMLFEIGMGAYTLAFLHLLAHSLYKAHSFLASGRTVAASKVAPFEDARVASRLAWSTAVAGVALLILWLRPELVENNAVLGAMLLMAVFGAVFGIPAGAQVLRKLALSGLAVALAPLYGAVHWLLGPVISAQPGYVLPLAGVVIGLVMVGSLAFISLFLLIAPQGPLARALRFHISHGFYLVLPFDQITARLADYLKRRKQSQKTPETKTAALGESL
ncbi:NADH dehydrogenase [Marinobacter salinus]|uniref:Probable inorganic carbon transporter subunit DabB n=1 Tax=Marinobacter salinus TaxID=1874317 RepID=A0A1D9GJH4_9GAMM|nr:NADH-quinone oxidoreductase subunit L [Marinobacter salinus]AOY87777.1 NADH dehydrogenase [Marinobacter salinus]